MNLNEYYRQLPKVDELLNNIELVQSGIPLSVLKMETDFILNDLRSSISNIKKNDGASLDISFDNIVESILKRSRSFMKSKLKRVINCTGVVIHTNLGRSSISNSAAEKVRELSSSFSNLEFDLDSGKRGSRYSHIEEILTFLTGAEAALVVNNNAAAVLLVLSTMAKDKKVVVSRGQLVEVGGAFRIPEVMKLGGCHLLEVGTTNKTHEWDYENAITDDRDDSMEIGALLKVHTSNYRILGFTSEVESDKLCQIAHKHGIPVIEDIGSGSLIDLSKHGITKEPTVKESIDAGVDVVTFSGDKMLGGPQAGIIVGRKKYIEMMKKNQLTRALRIDKMSIAALEATLREYLVEEDALENIPTLRMLIKKKSQIMEEAELLMNKMKESAKLEIMEMIDGESEVGGGTLPLEKLPTKLISFKLENMSVNNAVSRLRNLDLPIILRVGDDRLIIDVRTVDLDEHDIVAKSLGIIQENR